MSDPMAMNMGADLRLLLPEIIVVITGVIALMTGMLRRHELAMPITVLGLSIAALSTVPLIGDDTVIFSGTFRIDDLSVWAKLILLPTTALIAVLIGPSVRATDREATVHSLLSLTTVGALALAGAGDVMFLVLGTLLSSLGSFGLVAYPRDSRATEAAMKYFVFGSVTSAVMVFGLTFWFGGTGSTLLIDLDGLAGNPIAAGLGLTAVVIGLGYKAALVPFHFWAPDAYEGGPLAVAAYLSIVPKIGAVFALAYIVRVLPTDDIDWRLPIAVIAAVSMTYGNLAALAQTSVVRLLAYSSIAQTGYLLLGIVAVGRNDLAIQSLVIFAAAYATMNLGAFAIVNEIGREVTSFSGLGRTHVWHGAAMALFLFSLVGIPPTAGFLGKLLLFGAALDAGYAWLAVIAILNTVLSLAVYLRIIVPMYQPSEAGARLVSRTSIVWVVALVLTLGIGLAGQVLTNALGR